MSTPGRVIPAPSTRCRRAPAPANAAKAMLPMLMIVVVALCGLGFPVVALAASPPTIAPMSASVVPLQSQTFTASGGSGMGYTWTLTVNQSGGSINGSGATTAMYQAGAMGNTIDQIQVTDSNLETATAIVTVMNGVTITPFDPTVGVTEQQQFTAMGGKAPYTWAMGTNQSGMPTITGGGLYTAGAAAGSDTIKVTDSLGSSATDTITVVKNVAIGTLCTSSQTCPVVNGQRNCVDGVCCDSACTGQCQACNTAASYGTCVTVTGPPVGKRPACAMTNAMNVCSQKVCDGTNPTACTSFVGASMTCVPGSCVDMIGTPPSVCDGDGGCPQVQASSCAPFACVGGLCTTSCTDTSECSPGAYCDVTSGLCVTPDASAGDETDGGASAAGSSKSTGCSVGGIDPSEAGAIGVAFLVLARLAARRKKRR